MRSNCSRDPRLLEAAVLRRWGVADGLAVDSLAFNRGLARLQADERPPPRGASRLIGHIRGRYHRSMVADIEDAVVLATVCEMAYSAHDLWPHGLSDHLIDLLEAMEQHLFQEDAVVFPLLLADNPAAAAVVVQMTVQHNKIMRLLEGLVAKTGTFTIPAGACFRWRVLYLLCCRIDADLRAQMRLEESDLFPDTAAVQEPDVRQIQGPACPPGRAAGHARVLRAPESSRRET